MEFIADGLLIAAGLTAGLYCMVLSRRLRTLAGSGSGIGAQIESLDRALNDTRAALAETRERVGDLRASVKSSQGQLARDLKLAADLAERLDSGVANAEATMRRLYETENRLAAYEGRFDRSAKGAMAKAVLAAGPGESPDREPSDASLGSEDSTTRVELPDGTSRQVPTVERSESTGETGDAIIARPTLRGGGVEMKHTGTADSKSSHGSRKLKAERMML